MKEAHSIGIIGGADGPTAIYTTLSFREVLLIGAAALSSLVCLVGLLLHYRDKAKEKN